MFIVANLNISEIIRKNIAFAIDMHTLQQTGVTCARDLLVCGITCEIITPIEIGAS